MGISVAGFDISCVVCKQLVHSLVLVSPSINEKIDYIKLLLLLLVVVVVVVVVVAVVAVAAVVVVVVVVTYHEWRPCCTEIIQKRIYSNVIIYYSCYSASW
jgi:hypothetical protein